MQVSRILILLALLSIIFACQKNEHSEGNTQQDSTTQATNAQNAESQDTQQTTSNEEEEASNINNAELRVYTTPYEIFNCKNPDGTTETLLATNNIETGERGFIYRNSKKPNQDIALKVVANENDAVFEVTFPKDSKRYKLETCIACPDIICTNPDGSVQKFQLDHTLWGNRGTYRCVQSDNTVEYLRIEGSDNEAGMVVKYKATANAPWVTLQASNVNIGMMDVIQWFDISFPNEKPYNGARVEALDEPYGYTMGVPCAGGGGACPKSFEWINK